ncbi:hypothetical protein MARA_12170 [Mycolicibacterium arabiense]|uniref:Uncharacterized protein n=1 Tax=Mycolicibacterium arabiense TaxID=1286181 RepID=A0A7I7RUV7_9MYCO|nr:hypothetical protein [Mycolicibacterium arabiense]MCV7373126.1 hypothetical protein [Mycolicibacterium arabiense]BBY47749.1 hypothetical protein MARA_12170 [Mycolicibacterium arabiense]
MADQLTEDTLTALSLLTAAHGEKGRHKTLAGELATTFVHENPEDGHTRLVSGLLNLSVALTAQLCLSKGLTPDQANEVLQDTAELIIDMGTAE